MKASELKLGTEIEADTAKLKRMYADLALENAAMRELISNRPVIPSFRALRIP